MCNRLLQEFPDIAYSVSCTTRQPRGAETDGVAYFFLTQDEFQKRIDNGEFLEHACVHNHCYGTLKSTIYDAFFKNKTIILDIDVAGATQIRNYIKTLPPTDPLRAGFIDVFIQPPSLEELRRRLICRNEDSSETIALRMKNAEAEMASVPLYQCVIINDNLDQAYTELRNIIETKRN